MFNVKRTSVIVLLCLLYHFNLIDAVLTVMDETQQQPAHMSLDDCNLIDYVLKPPGRLHHIYPWSSELIWFFSNQSSDLADHFAQDDGLYLYVYNAVEKTFTPTNAPNWYNSVVKSSPQPTLHALYQDHDKFYLLLSNATLCHLYHLPGGWNTTTAHHANSTSIKCPHPNTKAFQAFGTLTFINSSSFLVSYVKGTAQGSHMVKPLWFELLSYNARGEQVKNEESSAFMLYFEDVGFIYPVTRTKSGQAQPFTHHANEFSVRVAGFVNESQFATIFYAFGDETMSFTYQYGLERDISTKVVYESISQFLGGCENIPNQTRKLIVIFEKFCLLIGSFHCKVHILMIVGISVLVVTMAIVLFSLIFFYYLSSGDREPSIDQETLLKALQVDRTKSAVLKSSTSGIELGKLDLESRRQKALALSSIFKFPGSTLAKMPEKNSPKKKRFNPYETNITGDAANLRRKFSPKNKTNSPKERLAKDRAPSLLGKSAKRSM